MKRLAVMLAVLSACGGTKAPTHAPIENTSTAPAPPTNPSTLPTNPPTPPSEPAAGDPATGFDLYVSAPDVATWKLDGEVRTERLPSRIRGLAPGHHTVEIDPTAGFVGAKQGVEVEAGKASVVKIDLQPATSTKP